MTPPWGKSCLPWGALDGLNKLRAGKLLRSSVYSDNPGDTSRMDELARPLTSALEGAWRTPTLRNITLTGPYMHDGIYGTLEEVVAHYNRGGDPGAPGVRAVQIRPLGLTDGEQADLVAFLQTLTEAGQPAWGTASVGGGGGVSGATGTGGGKGAESGGGPLGGSGAGPSGPDAGSGGPDASGVPSVCRGAMPMDAQITGSSLVGQPYTFAASGAAWPYVMGLPGGGSPTVLQVSWVSGPILDPTQAQAGFGLTFLGPRCVDVRVFTGVTFKVSGELGTCRLQIGVVPSEDNAVTNSPFGSCLAGAMCVSPLSAPIGIGTTVVRFSEMTGGSPLATPDPAALNGVQWVLTAPTGADAAGCLASFTVSDVSFVLGAAPHAMPPQ